MSAQQLEQALLTTAEVPGSRQPLRRSGTFAQITAEDVQQQQRARVSEAQCRPFVTRSLELSKDPAVAGSAAALAVFPRQGAATTEAIFDTAAAPAAFSLEELRTLPAACRDTTITVGAQRARVQLQVIKHARVGDDSVLLQVQTSVGNQRIATSSLTVQRGDLQINLGVLGRSAPSAQQMVELGERAVGKLDSSLPR